MIFLKTPGGSEFSFGPILGVLVLSLLGLVELVGHLAEIWKAVYNIGAKSLPAWSILPLLTLLTFGLVAEVWKGWKRLE